MDARDGLARARTSIRWRRRPARRPFRRICQAVHSADLVALAAAPAPAGVRELMSAYLEVAANLGKRTGELHLALAADSANPSFAPEPMGADDLAVASGRALSLAERTLAALESAIDSGRLKLSQDATARARRLLGARTMLAERLAPLPSAQASAKIRIHGDYRLAQVLLAEGDFYIQNVEGHLVVAGGGAAREAAGAARRGRHAAFVQLRRARGAVHTRDAPGPKRSRISSPGLICGRPGPWPRSCSSISRQPTARRFSRPQP